MTNNPILLSADLKNAVLRLDVKCFRGRISKFLFLKMINGRFIYVKVKVVKCKYFPLSFENFTNN